jgi:hypothetical protein
MRTTQQLLAISAQHLTLAPCRHPLPKPNSGRVLSRTWTLLSSLLVIRTPTSPTLAHRPPYSQQLTGQRLIAALRHEPLLAPPLKLR